MPRKCCVYNCTFNGKEKVLRKFPHYLKNTEQFSEWVNAAGNLKLLSISAENVYNSKFICNNHFNMKISKLKRLLPILGIPDINLPEPISVPYQWLNANADGHQSINLKENTSICKNEVILSEEMPLEKFEMEGTVKMEDVEDYNQENLSEEIINHDIKKEVDWAFFKVEDNLSHEVILDDLDEKYDVEKERTLEIILKSDNKDNVYLIDNFKDEMVNNEHSSEENVQKGQ